MVSFPFEFSHNDIEERTLVAPSDGNFSAVCYLSEPAPHTYKCNECILGSHDLLRHIDKKKPPRH